MSSRNLVCAVVLGSFLLSGAAIGDSTARLVVVVSGFTSREGQALCRLFRDSEGFPVGAADATATSPIAEDSTARCVFTDVRQGPFAIAVAHDENANGALDRNFLGIPREPFGFSGGAESDVLGPPPFERARSFLRGDLTLSVPLE